MATATVISIYVNKVNDSFTVLQQHSYISPLLELFPEQDDFQYTIVTEINTGSFSTKFCIVQHTGRNLQRAIAVSRKLVSQMNSVKYLPYLCKWPLPTFYCPSNKNEAHIFCRLSFLFVRWHLVSIIDKTAVGLKGTTVFPHPASRECRRQPDCPDSLETSSKHFPLSEGFCQSLCPRTALPFELFSCGLNWKYPDRAHVGRYCQSIFLQLNLCHFTHYCVLSTCITQPVMQNVVNCFYPEAYFFFSF